MNKIHLIEDHHEAYYLWKKEGLNNKTLVHLDAHIDFGFHDIKPIEQIFREAKTKRDLTGSLEKMILFKRLGFEEEKQTNIGNYIYPAMRDGIVDKFYWVIPGDRDAFRASLKSLRNMIKSFARQDPYMKGNPKINDFLIETTIYDRPFFITNLDSLPPIKDETLLDIDVDFLTTPLLKVANATDQIGRRTPWIYPAPLVGRLNDKIKAPVYTTISYSVNGGFTPMKYKFLGDEIYLRLASNLRDGATSILDDRHKLRSLDEWGKLEKRVEGYDGFEPGFKRKFLADIFFNSFILKPKRNFYEKAIAFNPSYAVSDNNYGPLYLAKRKIKEAKREFEKVLRVDEDNPSARIGLGNIYLRRRRFQAANREFLRALKNVKPKTTGNTALVGSAIAEFHLKKYGSAEKKFLQCEEREKPNSDTRFFLARIYESKGDYPRAQEYYKNAMQMGRNDINIISRMLQIVAKTNDEETIKFIKKTIKQFKKTIRYSARRRAKGKALALKKSFKKKIGRIENKLKLITLKTIL